jgi:tetratricopeptide (TPR) repeat protein
VRYRIAWVPWISLLACLAGPPALASVESELAFHRGVVAFGEGRLEEARKQFGTVLEEDPEDTSALHYLGLIAQKEEDHGAAIDLYDRALAIDPEDTDVQMDRGIALLDAGRLAQARAAFEQVIQAEPDRAKAHLFAGIAIYRQGAYTEAAPYFDRAAQLDPSLADEARYYAGLSQALAGNLDAAATAFADVEQEAPLSPLGESAQNLREQLAPAAAEERRWQAALTGGMEWDDNPLVAGTGTAGVPVDTGNPDWRGVVRPRGSFRFLSGDNYSVTGGVDGYLAFQIKETQVDLQIYNPWLAGGYSIGPTRLGLRVDYAYTMNDLTDPFRHLVRTTPTVLYRPADWALTQGFYQYNWKDFLVGQVEGTVLDRDGWQHVFGFNQFFFLPEPYTYVRVGAYGDFNHAKGGEYSYDGMEANFGAGYDFPYDISLVWLYRFLYRDYRQKSLFSGPPTDPFQTRRLDHRHVLTAELAKGITEHWTVSVGGAFTWNLSNVDFYDYSRHIVGSYLTYRF